MNWLAAIIVLFKILLVICNKHKSLVEKLVKIFFLLIGLMKSLFD